jgi:hypothetical protein
MMINVIAGTPKRRALNRGVKVSFYGLKIKLLKELERAKS